MQRNLRVAAFQFREAFDGELARAFLTLQVGPNTARDGASERYSDRYDTWLNTAAHPRIVHNIFLIDAETDRRDLRVRRWNADTHAFDPTPWPGVLGSLRPQLERELVEFNSGHPPDHRLHVADDEPLVLGPIRNVIVNPPAGSRPQAVEPIFGFTVIELDLAYITHEFLPELAERHFVHPEGDVYRVAVVRAAPPRRVIYRSHPDAPVDLTHADAVE
jgi:hypothetical protein